MDKMFAVKVENDQVEFWGPYDSEELAGQVGEAFVINDNTWKVVPVTDGMKFSGRPE